LARKVLIVRISFGFFLIDAHFCYWHWLRGFGYRRLLR